MFPRHDEDAACEGKREREDGEEPDDIESNEHPSYEMQVRKKKGYAAECGTLENWLFLDVNPWDAMSACIRRSAAGMQKDIDGRN
jgi:hypothetical protein